MSIQIDKNRQSKLIAEIGCNHRGELDTALRMIHVATQYSDVVKFQKRNPKELLSKEEYESPHPNPYNSYGSTYGEHREHLEFSFDEHKVLKSECDKLNKIYSCSVWDTFSAEQIIALDLEIIKIPSACNLNRDLLDHVFDNHKNEIHISMGMTSKKDVKKIIEYSKYKKRNKDLVIYACTSSYPASLDQLYLNELKFYNDNFLKEIKHIGFSGHHTSIIPDIAAIAYGAKYIERHFTLNKSWKGTDHKASLESDELRNLMRNIVEIEKTLKNKPDNILDVEQSDYKKLKRIQTL